MDFPLRAIVMLLRGCLTVVPGMCVGGYMAQAQRSHAMCTSCRVVVCIDRAQKANLGEYVSSNPTNSVREQTTAFRPPSKIWL
jgi:hypothetical protein